MKKIETLNFIKKIFQLDKGFYMNRKQLIIKECIVEIIWDKEYYIAFSNKKRIKKSI